MTVTAQKLTTAELASKYQKMKNAGTQDSPFSPIHEVITTDDYGNKIQIGAFGEQKTANILKQISATFATPLDTYKFETDNSTEGPDAEAQFNATLLKVPSNGGGSSSITTKDTLRYRTAESIEVCFTYGVSDTPEIGNDAIIGLYDDESGVYLGFVNGEFKCGYRNTEAVDEGGSVPDTLSPAIDVSAYGNFRNLHRFRITFGYLGVGDILFEVRPASTEDDRVAEWQVLYLFKTDGNLQDRTHIGNPILPMRAEVSDTTSQDFYLYSGSWSASTWGLEISIQDEPFFTQGSRTVSVNNGQELPIVAFRSKASFGGATNKVKSQLLTSEFSTASEGLYRINFYGYPAGTITDGSWADIDSNSVLETNDTTNYSTFDGRLVFSKTIAIPSQGTGVGASTLDFKELGIESNPGEEFLITKECIVEGGGNDITTWNIAYKDLF